MSLFQKLVSRGSAVMREWNAYEGLDDNSGRMLAEIAASTLVNVCGEEMKNWTPQEQQDRANAMRIALTSAFQIGRSSSTVPRRRSKKKRKNA